MFCRNQAWYGRTVSISEQNQTSPNNAQRIFTPLYNATYQFSSLFSSVTPRLTTSLGSPSFATAGMEAWFKQHCIWRRMTDSLFHFIQSDTSAVANTACTARKREEASDRFVYKTARADHRKNPTPCLGRSQHKGPGQKVLNSGSQYI